MKDNLTKMAENVFTGAIGRSAVYLIDKGGLGAFSSYYPFKKIINEE